MNKNKQSLASQGPGKQSLASQGPGKQSLASQGPGNLVLTGGHAATTAVAVVEEIRSQGRDWKLYWIGVKNAIEGKKVVTLESEVLPRLGVSFLPLTAGRLQRRFTFWTIPSLFKIPVGFIQSFYYLAKIKPQAILSFGGFASFPVVVSGKLLGIPAIVHEQTSAAGRANLVVAKFATKITLARAESKKYFRGSSWEVVGNPVMKEIKAARRLSRVKDIPVVFVTGGSRGSQTINEALEKVLKQLLTKYKLIHQTGGIDYLKFSKIRERLPQALRDNYEVFLRVNPLEISKVYARASIIVSRAGANTVSEIMVVRRPAILIPLPISYLDEQTKNAKIAEKYGIAKVIPQSSLTPQKLLSAIEEVNAESEVIRNRIKDKKSPDLDAARRLVNLIGGFMK
jgi:UDP-N-acetylglucosamine--N-acetylmuramyl-(pentapeptide) pyrophosphoryl-undecaprenol N-acetylglucosamine transferase